MRDSLISLIYFAHGISPKFQGSPSQILRSKFWNRSFTSDEPIAKNVKLKSFLLMLRDSFYPWITTPKFLVLKAHTSFQSLATRAKRLINVAWLLRYGTNVTIGRQRLLNFMFVASQVIFSIRIHLHLHDLRPNKKYFNDILKRLYIHTRLTLCRDKFITC